MDNPLGQAGAEAIKQALEWARAGGAIVSAEAPEIARQYLSWRWGIDVAQAVGTGMIFLSFLSGTAFCIYKENKREGDWSGGVVFCGIGTVMFSVGTIFEAMDVWKIYSAPKIVLIEGLAALLK